LVECIVCDKKVGFWEGDKHRRCSDCVKQNSWPEGHYNWREPTPGIISAAATTEGPLQYKPTTTAASAANFCAAIIAICSVVAFLILFLDGNVLLAFAILASGLLSAVVVAVLAEIGHNVAGLCKWS